MQKNLPGILYRVYRYWNEGGRLFLIVVMFAAHFYLAYLKYTTYQSLTAHNA